MDNARLGCFVPARLGSVRVPRKNIRALGGRPMIEYTIVAARATGLFDDVFVCTESEEIAAVARRAGATVPELLPAELCGPEVASWVPCVEIASRLDGPRVDALVCLQPTSPFRSPDDIARGVELFRSSGADFVQSVTPVDPHYFHWALTGDDGWRMVFGDEYLRERTQLPPRYRPNGSVKIAKRDALESQGSFFGPSLECFETPEERSLHVGSPFEFEVADFLATTRSAA
jgi:CMP-N,N'-diacetyllegionaminic acid synthase